MNFSAPSGFFLIGTLITIDQLFKYTFHQNSHQGWPLIFSITSSSISYAIPIMTILGLLAALGYIKTHTINASINNIVLAQYGICIVLAGGLSNLIELFARGYVTDIINLERLHLNVSDIYIIFGSILIISTMIFGLFHTCPHTTAQQK